MWVSTVSIFRPGLPSSYGAVAPGVFVAAASGAAHLHALPNGQDDDGVDCQCYEFEHVSSKFDPVECPGRYDLTLVKGKGRTYPGPSSWGFYAVSVVNA
jgi:hypothetical protein